MIVNPDIITKTNQIDLKDKTTQKKEMVEKIQCLSGL